MNGTISGMAILILAGVMNACFALPMKYTRRWAWENTWLAWTLLTLLVLPCLVTWTTVPDLVGVYRSAPDGIVFEVIGFGLGWGVAQVFFGLAVDLIGIALTFSLVLGISAAVGTLIPLLRFHPERLNTPAGYGVLGGAGMVLFGVFFCAIAGRMREKALNALDAKRKNITRGLALAILSGFGASCVNLGFSFGAPLVAAARSYGAAALLANNAVWMPFMVAGAIPNLGYCLSLLLRNRTVGKFPAGGARHWSLAAIMAVCWFASALLYGIATVELGAWGPILGWPIFMSLIVITASILGMMAGEWKSSGAAPVRIQWAGVTLLVLAVFILANTGRLLS